jgi:hypothetical protein
VKPADLVAARDRTIPDVLPGPDDPPLRVLFCGINPGLVSAATGHHCVPGLRYAAGHRRTAARCGRHHGVGVAQPERAERALVVGGDGGRVRPLQARGIHHTALISSDVRRTVEFYQDLLDFPLIDMFENRDLPGSTHFFFDVPDGARVELIADPLGEMYGRSVF